jgi:hypothetical protein
MALSGESLAHLRPNADNSIVDTATRRLTPAAKVEILRNVRFYFFSELRVSGARLRGPNSALPTQA